MTLHRDKFVKGAQRVRRRIDSRPTAHLYRHCQCFGDLLSARSCLTGAPCMIRDTGITASADRNRQSDEFLGFAIERSRPLRGAADFAERFEDVWDQTSQFDGIRIDVFDDLTELFGHVGLSLKTFPAWR